MYYAIFDSREKVIYNGWEEVCIGGLDLHRFCTKRERDEFVEESEHASVISSKDARKYHKEQFRWWRQ